MIRNSKTVSEGELLVERMCEQAQKYYNGDDGVRVFANSRYDNKGIEVTFDFGYTVETYTFEKLENVFVELQKQRDKLN